MIGDDGAIEIAVPRDRNGSFEPQIVPKGQTRLDGFDDRIISLYARGLSVREIQAHLRELYGVEVSPDLISRVTDAVLEEVREWQNRPLDLVYPVATRCGSRFATKVWCATKPSMSRSRSTSRAKRRCSGCGSSRPRAPSSGSR